MGQNILILCTFYQISLFAPPLPNLKMAHSMWKTLQKSYPQIEGWGRSYTFMIRMVSRKIKKDPKPALIFCKVSIQNRGKILISEWHFCNALRLFHIKPMDMDKTRICDPVRYGWPTKAHFHFDWKCNPKTEHRCLDKTITGHTEEVINVIVTPAPDQGIYWEQSCCVGT